MALKRHILNLGEMSTTIADTKLNEYYKHKNHVESFVKHALSSPNEDMVSTIRIVFLELKITSSLLEELSTLPRITDRFADHITKLRRNVRLNIPLRIGVSGSIGVGKSCFTISLAKLLNGTVYSEPVDENPFLPLFYNDQKKYAFETQKFFLLSRIAIHRESRSGDIHIYDRTIYEDAIFAGYQHRIGNMEKHQLDEYMNLFEENTKDLPRPHIIIYLRASPQTLMKRIKERNRAFETANNGVTMEYLSGLTQYYEEIFNDFATKKNSPTKVLVFTWEKFRNVREIWSFVAPHAIASIC